MVRGGNRGNQGSVTSNRKDPAWKYGSQVEVPNNDKGYVYLKCSFCGKIVKGGVKRLKDHLAKTHKNVGACPKVPKEVEEEIVAFMDGKDIKKRKMVDEMEEICRIGAYLPPSSYDDCPSGPFMPSSGSQKGSEQARGPMDAFVNAGGTGPGTNANQTTLNASWKKEERAKVCLSIGRCFFDNALPFYICTKASFKKMVDDIANFGRGFKPPSMYEMSTWILNEEVKSATSLINEVKASWKQTGCSIMSDGWTDIRNRHLINFLVNNPRGTWFLKSVDASDEVKDAKLIFKLLDDVVEEVGEENVVQVISDNAANYKLAGQMLMEKRKQLYWTPCAAHCIDLMLEDIMKLPLHASIFKKSKNIINYIYNHGWVLAMIRKHAGGDLVKPAVTRFATAFLTLQRLLEAKEPLESFFTSSKWVRSAYATKPEGKNLRNVILRSKSFWPGVAYVIKCTKPLVMVLRMVDSEKHPPMGFIYEAMDRAKEQMAENLDKDEKRYQPLWDIIDRRWDVQLHRHLHAAAYFLNPQYQYEPTFSRHPEIKTGLYCCMERMIPDRDERVKVDLQIDSFRSASGLFGRDIAIATRKRRNPADWWLAYGDETPELTRFAVRILSLCCSSSGCERNWSSFNQVHTKRRNRLEQKKLNDLVYVMYNIKLKERSIKRKSIEDPLSLDRVDSDDEWIADIEGSTAYGDLDNYVPIEDIVDEDGEGTSGASKRRKKRARGKGKEVVIEEEEDIDEEEEETDKDNEVDAQIEYMDESAEDSDEELLQSFGL